MSIPTFSGMIPQPSHQGKRIPRAVARASYPLQLEYKRLLEELYQTQENLSRLQARLNILTDPKEIDTATYALLSVQSHYEHLHQKLRDLGLRIKALTV